MEVQQVQPVQMNIYQSNTYRKDLSWLHFDDELRIQQRQQVKDQPYGRFVEIQNNLRRKKLHRTNQGCNFTGGSFSKRGNVRVQFNLKAKSTPPSWKIIFPQEQSIYFPINSTCVVRRRPACQTLQKSLDISSATDQLHPEVLKVLAIYQTQLSGDLQLIEKT